MRRSILFDDYYGQIVGNAERDAGLEHDNVDCIVG